MTDPAKREHAAALLAITLLLVVGCGDSKTDLQEAQADPASIAQLTGPWLQEPVVLDLPLRNRIELACRRLILTADSRELRAES